MQAVERDIEMCGGKIKTKVNNPASAVMFEILYRRRRLSEKWGY